MIYVIVVVAVLGLSAGAWWASGRARARTRIDRTARRSDAEAAAKRDRLGIHEPPYGGGL